MRFVKGLLGGKKKSSLLIPIFIISALAVFFLIIPTNSHSAEIQNDANIIEQLDEDENPYTTVSNPSTDVLSEDFYIRIQIDGKTVDTLYESFDVSAISQDYLISSNNPYIWPFSIKFEEDEDDLDSFEETSSSYVTITVPQSPSVSTINHKMPQFGISLTPDKKNTIVTIKSGTPGTLVFSYGNAIYYFSVAR